MSPYGVGLVHDEGLTVGASAVPDVEERRKAVRQVAALSRDAGDCARLLTILGLEASEGKN